MNPIEAINIVDTDAQPVRVGSLWEAQPVVLVFVRHFG